MAKKTRLAVHHIPIAKARINLELQDPGMATQIREGHAACDRGECRSLDDFLAEIKTSAQASGK